MCPNVYIVGEYRGRGRFGGVGTNLVTHVSSFPGGADISISLVGSQRGAAGPFLRQIQMYKYEHKYKYKEVAVGPLGVNNYEYCKYLFQIYHIQCMMILREASYASHVFAKT